MSKTAYELLRDAYHALEEDNRRLTVDVMILDAEVERLKELLEEDELMRADEQSG